MNPTDSIGRIPTKSNYLFIYNKSTGAASRRKCDLFYPLLLGTLKIIKSLHINKK